ncbi:acetoacetate decarboxylase [Sphingomonas sp. C8-2]|jgi:acetoacetate decarboxylase|nr:acetoacetate decarboxylase [Sphingomonas sp. C8-2]
MAGATHFLTPTGQASLVDDAVYGWGADMLTVYLRCDPARLQALLPAGLKVADGLCMAYVGAFQSTSEDQPAAMLRNPAGAVYNEAALSIACTHGDRRGYFPAFVWVDKEWSLIRGWLNGYPKKIGAITLARPHPYNPVTGGLREGAVVGGICARHGFTLFRLGLTVTRAGDAGDLRSRPATFGHRHWPALHPTQTPVSELVEVNRTDLRVGDVWAGEPFIELGSAPDEALDCFADHEVLAGVTYSYGFRIGGATRLASIGERPSGR